MRLHFKASIGDEEYTIKDYLNKDVTMSLTDILLLVYKTGLSGEYIDIHDKDGCLYSRTWGKQ